VILGIFVFFSEDKTVQEKRHYERIDFERQAQVDFFTEVYDHCQVKNISLSGMFVAGKFTPNVESKCYVKLVQKGKNVYLTLEALAKVVHHENDGVGLKFISMSYESLLSLEMILLYQERKESAGAEMKIPDKLPFEVNDDTAGSPNKYNPFLNNTG
jgi:hypothetical protein